MPLLKNYFVTKNESEKENYAKSIASKMSTPYMRKKSFVDLTGILCAIEYFKSINIDFDTNNSLHKISSVFEEFSIADVYYNNWRIDVITCFNTTPIRVPKFHMDYDIAADYYLVVKLDPNLRDYRVLGFIRPDDLLTSSRDYKYYYPEGILPTETLVQEITSRRGAHKRITGKHSDCEALFLRFIDNELSTGYKKTFIKHILTCETCTKKFADFERFNNLSKCAMHFPYIVRAYYKRIVAFGENAFKQSKIRLGFLNKIRFVQNSITALQNFMQKIFYVETEEDIKIAQNSKDAIDLIFKNKRQFDIKPAAVKEILQRKKVTGLIIAVVIFVCLVTGGILKSALTPQVQEKPPLLEQPVESYNPNENAVPASDPVNYEDSADVSPFDDMMAKPVSSGDFDAQVISSVNKISWEVPKSVANKGQYTRFLQIAGKNIKLNLQNDLLLTNDVAKNKEIRAEIQFINDGTIMSMKISKGSGSAAIDKIVEKSIFETFSYMKPPKINLGAVNLTLVISL